MVHLTIYADLHIHGSHSRGTSNKLSIPKLEEYAKLKGINVLGTGDFTHPEWLEHLKEHLTQKENGTLETKNGFTFLLQTELSSIYKQDGKTRKIHQVILAPSFEIVEQIQDKLKQEGRIDYGGRPIFGLTAPEMVELVKETDKRCEIIPAHIWTPWFSLYGANSGFDSMEACYQDQTKHINALETGLSSDPPMNWRLSELDDITMVSNSDAHSYWPWRIGREANAFDLDEPDYDGILNAIRTRENFEFTIEVDPSYGKYHWDGHRKCDVRFSPEEAREHDNVCPECGKTLTIGVMHRVLELADRKEPKKPKGAHDYRTLLPLSELLSRVMDYGVSTKTVWRKFNALTGRKEQNENSQHCSELEVLLEMPEQELENRTDKTIAEAILLNRREELCVKSGYDGVYGEAEIDLSGKGQKKLGEY